MIQRVCHRVFNQDAKHFSLHWSLTNNCNYRCDYCGVWKDEKIHPHSKIIKYINYINTFKNVDTVLFGGEPLTHPHIISIVNRIESDIRICTNLNRSLYLLKQLKPNIKMIVSLHIHKTDLPTFAEKIKFSCENFDFTKLKVMYDSRCRVQSKKIWEYFKVYEKMYKNIKVYLDMVYHPECEITDDDLKFFDSKQIDDRMYLRTEDGESHTSYNQIRRMFDGFPTYFGYTCECGPKGLFINSNGDVSYCQTKKNKGQIIFNVNQDDFLNYDHILERSIICDMDEPCYEVVIPREK